MNCYCGSKILFNSCCEPYLMGKNIPSSPEDLMRSRYTAYCIVDIEYLVATTHISTRKLYSKQSIKEFATTNQWLKLEIVSSSENTVDFKAYYLDYKLQPKIHHEISTFVHESGNWYYVDGVYK